MWMTDIQIKPRYWSYRERYQLNYINVDHFITFKYFLKDSCFTNTLTRIFILLIEKSFQVQQVSIFFFFLLPKLCPVHKTAIHICFMLSIFITDNMLNPFLKGFARGRTWPCTKTQLAHWDKARTRLLALTFEQNLIIPLNWIYFWTIRMWFTS